jgi:hypothetical protein
MVSPAVPSSSGTSEWPSISWFSKRFDLARSSSVGYRSTRLVAWRYVAWTMFGPAMTSGTRVDALPPHTKAVTSRHTPL